MGLKIRVPRVREMDARYEIWMPKVRDMDARVRDMDAKLKIRVPELHMSRINGEVKLDCNKNE